MSTKNKNIYCACCDKPFVNKEQYVYFNVNTGKKSKICSKCEKLAKTVKKNLVKIHVILNYLSDKY